MLEFIPLKNYNAGEELVQIWNRAFNNIFPIDLILLKQNTTENDDLLDEGSKVALLDQKVVGFVATKVWKSQFKIETYEHVGFISALVVDPLYQRKGIGTQLLMIAEESLKMKQIKLIHIGRDTFNYFPGVPFDFINSKKFFEKRGYTTTRHTHDLICHHNQLKHKTVNAKYRYKFANMDDREAMLDFFKRSFPGRWEYECIEYFEKGGTGGEFLILLDEAKVIGFCRVNDHLSKQIAYNINWRGRFKRLGGIGPLGIDINYRKQNLGYDITATAINSLIERGVSDIIIDWTSLIDFYRKFGFEVWKVYYYMSKEIKETKNSEVKV